MLKTRKLYEAIILLGSNMGDRLKMFSQAIAYLEQCEIKIAKYSGVYETAAWGIEDQPPFLNQVLIIETGLSPHDLLAALLGIEIKMGRLRNKKWEQRSIDLDILFYNNMILNDDGLIIPHPHLHERRFTLVPLNEIVSDFIHPVFKKSIKQLLADCIDDKEVRLVT